MSFFPREHGAYGQMSFPLVTALAVAGVTVPALLTVTAVVASFLAHEPLLVVLGMRGPRARREAGASAWRWLAVTAGIAVAAGLTAIWLTPPAHRWAFAVPLVPAAMLVPALVARREKTSQAEIAVALAFSFAAVPVSLAANATAAVGFSIAVPFALMFVAATLAVRVVILKVRGGGNPRAAAFTRRAAFAVAAIGGAGVTWAALTGLMPPRVLVAAAPGVLIALGVALFPPSPARLRTVGWTLVAASFLTTAILVV